MALKLLEVYLFFFPMEIGLSPGVYIVQDSIMFFAGQKRCDGFLRFYPWFSELHLEGSNF